MNPERWERVKAIFGTVLETAPSNRSALLGELCAHDASMRAEVDRLLLADAEAGDDFLRQPEIPADLLDPNSNDPSARIGRRIGPYQLIEKIGTGGMGEVYRAFRADLQYRKEVAIKLVKGGEDSEFVLDRFKNERQVLANLEHPNIARLLDGGTTEAGEPYFAMELIHGVTITEYCDAHKLSVTERLNLFLQVCSAVEYAHQRLIIHRDLKPSNILITAEGSPILLDFGVAKILDPANLSNAEPTISFLRLLTPSYASPEQIKGEAITTASDVYSLGVLLYELLTGHRPYRLAGHSPHEIAIAVCTLDPERPSTVIRRVVDGGELEKATISPISVSAMRHASPEKLQHRLRGDLDAIVLKALRKEPERRYASVDQFAADIRRHLENLPVTASRDTFQYRTSKFVRRHRTAIAATVLTTIALISGLIIATYEARIARAERAQAERRLADVLGLADTLLFDVHDAIQNLPGATSARKLLVEKALNYLDRVRATGSDTSLKREVAYGYEKMGDVQGNPDQANLGDTVGALESYRKALSIRQSLRSSNATERQDDALWLSGDYNKLGACLLHKGDFQEALANFREAVRIDQDLARSTDTLKVTESLAGSYFQLARGLTDTGDYPAALETFQKAANIRESEHATNPTSDARIRTRLAGTYGYMSGVYSAQGNMEQAIVSETKARDIMEQLLSADPTNAIFQEFTDEAYYWIGHYQQKAGQQTNALKSVEKAFTGFEQLSIADPADARLQEYVANCYRSIGTLQASQGRIDQGMAKIEHALKIFQKLKQADPTNGDKLTDVAYAQSAMGDAYEDLAESKHSSKEATKDSWTQARQWYEKSLSTWNEIKRTGSISATDNGEPPRIEKQIQDCDEKLSRKVPTQSVASGNAPSK